MESEARQTCGRSGCAEGARQIQRWASSVHEQAGGGHVQNSDRCIGGERCELRYVHSQEPNVLELDWHTKEMSKVSGRVELDFMSWLDVNEEDVKQPEYRPRSCKQGERWEIVREELQRWRPTVPGTFLTMGSFEYVIVLFSKAMTWRSGVSGSTKDHVFGRIKSSLSGRCHERDGS